MGLTLKIPPGYSDLQDSAIVANTPALGIDLAKIYGNAAFGKVRCEVFQGQYQSGDTVPLPISDIDGFAYQRAELIYLWAVESSASLATGYNTGKDSLWYASWRVDQATGQVYSDEWYRRSGSHYDPTHTNDGVLRVFTIAQRQQSSLIMAASPTYAAITAGWIAQDKPLSQQLIQAMNKSAKFSVVNAEVFYLGEYYNGQAAALPISPCDGYHYSAAECTFAFSWRWTALGNSSTLVEPLVSLGQMATMKASVNSSGVVSCSVAYIDDVPTLTTYTTYGRIAVFAFCKRSATPAGLSLSGSFTEIGFDAFMPGTDLPADTVVAPIVDDIGEAIATPEFFGPTNYADGDTIPLPTSVVDPTYTYTRQELHYIYEIADTTNQVGSHLRVPVWFTDINQATGVVKVNVWRLPPGGPELDDNNTLGRITVTVMARRQANPPAAITAAAANPTGSDSASVQTQDTPTVSAVAAQAISGTGTGPFTLSPAGTIIFLVWNQGVRFDFSQSSPTSFTTSFTVNAGDSLYAVCTT